MSLLEALGFKYDYTRFCCYGNGCSNTPKNEDAIHHRGLPFCSDNCKDEFENFLTCKECGCIKQIDEGWDIYRCFSVPCMLNSPLPISK